MNKPLITIFVLLLSCCWACKKDLDVYEGESGIYFSTQNVGLDTIFVPWGLKESDITEQEYTLKVNLFGAVKPYDRKFKVRVTTDASDSLAAEVDVDFRALSTEYVMPANQAEAPIKITLLRRPDLAQQARRFTVHLEETDELKFLYSREVSLDSTQWVGDVKVRKLDLQRTIYMDERFQVPNWWPLCGTKYFGTYSSKKMVLICDVMNIARADFVAPFSLENRITDGYLKFVGRYMHRWLQEQENPILEDDGTPMEMGSASKI